MTAFTIRLTGLADGFGPGEPPYVLQRDSPLSSNMTDNWVPRFPDGNSALKLQNVNITCRSNLRDTLLHLSFPVKRCYTQGILGYEVTLLCGEAVINVILTGKIQRLTILTSSRVTLSPTPFLAPS